MIDWQKEPLPEPAYPGFPMRRANAQSLGRRKLIFGHGVNDANYMVNPRVNGKIEPCPFYAEWYEMLRRAFSAKYHLRFPSYPGTTVHEPWLSFMCFRAWMIKQKDWDKKRFELDKDILDPTRKHYGPETCVFVSQALNSLLLDSGAARGEWPQGVNWCKRERKFRAQISKCGKNHHMGYFSSSGAAANAYLAEKIPYIYEVGMERPDPKVQRGLLHHIVLMSRVYPE